MCDKRKFIETICCKDGDCLIAQALAGYVAHVAGESRSASIAIDKIKGVSYLEN